MAAPFIIGMSVTWSSTIGRPSYPDSFRSWLALWVLCSIIGSARTHEVRLSLAPRWLEEDPLVRFGREWLRSSKLPPPPYRLPRNLCFEDSPILATMRGRTPASTCPAAATSRLCIHSGWTPPRALPQKLRKSLNGGGCRISSRSVRLLDHPR